MNQVGKPQQKSVSIHNTPLTIYRDDHRNNTDFLKKHPNTIVLPHDAPKKHKHPHHHHSAHKHDPKVKTKPSHSTVRSGGPRHGGPDKIGVNGVEHDDDYDLEYHDHETNNTQEEHTDYDSENENSFLFHEMAGEEYDPERDVFEQQDSEKNPVYSGAGITLETNTAPIDQIVVDPNSFVLQKDAQDGSVSFKASVVFDFGDELEDFDVIVTHITG